MTAARGGRSRLFFSRAKNHHYSTADVSEISFQLQEAFLDSNLNIKKDLRAGSERRRGKTAGGFPAVGVSDSLLSMEVTGQKRHFENDETDGAAVHYYCPFDIEKSSDLSLRRAPRRPQNVPPSRRGPCFSIEYVLRTRTYVFTRNALSFSDEIYKQTERSHVFDHYLKYVTH